jgi:hypothetical protein
MEGGEQNSTSVQGTLLGHKLVQWVNISTLLDNVMYNLTNVTTNEPALTDTKNFKSCVM